MKTAFVHDRIAHEWWAEAVLRSLISEDTHDEWVLFAYYSTQTRWRVGEKKYRIVTALPRRLNRLFITCNTRKLLLLSTLFDYRNLMFRFPLLTNRLSRKIKKYVPDHIIMCEWNTLSIGGYFTVHWSPYNFPATSWVYSLLKYTVLYVLLFLSHGRRNCAASW